MQRRSDAQSEQMKLRAFYGIGALAQFAQLSRHMMARILHAHGVKLVRVGRALLVPLSEIQKKMPPLWESLCSLQEASPRGRRGIRRRLEGEPT